MKPKVTRWSGARPPSEGDLERILRDEGLAPGWWSNGPGDRYGEHSHPYHKVLYCAHGSICFIVASDRIDLASGDRLDLPPATPHAAVVGPQGVRCVEAARAP
jgi:hypothetical protein